jgi:shikimate kinase
MSHVCPPRAIALVGLPGCGKSTVGKQLARKLAFSFIDSDQVIESRLGCSIRDYFEREGEERFRDLEQQVIAELMMQVVDGTDTGGHCLGRIVSTGGGAVLRLANRQTLRSHSQVVYLRATAEELFRRLKHDKTRPLLQVADPLARLRELYKQRDPLYRECAHHVIETGRPSVHTLVNMVLSQLELAQVLSKDSMQPSA